MNWDRILIDVIQVIAISLVAYMAYDLSKVRRSWEKMKEDLRNQSLTALAAGFAVMMQREGMRQATATLTDPGGEFAGGIIVVTDAALLASMQELSEMHYGEKGKKL